MTSQGHRPKSGEDVILPENNQIVISETVAEQLGTVTVPSTSELIFAENIAGIEFNIGGMKVYGGLSAGSETCRYETDLTITLHGARPTDLDIFGKSASTQITHKGISVDGGVLSLHGKRYYPTWTRLAQTVPAGRSYLLLQETVNWQAGQQIVLTTTAIHDSRNWHQNEILTIASVENNPVQDVGAIIYLTSPVGHSHIANSGYQAEVGLLTRNIKIQGATDDSEPNDPDMGTCLGNSHFGTNMSPCGGTDTTGFGGHIIVHNSGKGYVEGVELYRMGQTNML